MLAEISRAFETYIRDVFATKLDWWLLVGFAAQSLFAARFIVQWIASERAGRSVMPLIFWFFSLGGSALLLLYALYRRDVVFIGGQSFVAFVYMRNLYFILRERKLAAASLGGALPRRARWLR